MKVVWMNQLVGDRIVCMGAWVLGSKSKTRGTQIHEGETLVVKCEMLKRTGTVLNTGGECISSSLPGETKSNESSQAGGRECYATHFPPKRKGTECLEILDSPPSQTVELKPEVKGQPTTYRRPLGTTNDLIVHAGELQNECQVTDVRVELWVGTKRFKHEK
jgi:hypothetical protein